MTNRDDDALPAAARRVAAALEQAGLAARIVTHARTTRTAEAAAEACGCAVGRIVKSLVFRGARTGAPRLLLVSGQNRVDEAAAEAAIGEPLERPDANYVRSVTGYAIGGVPPLGHAQRLAAWIDEDLLTFPTVWAAAGTPTTVFETEPERLRAATGATPIRVKLRASSRP